jgi:hypothetical protein
MAKGSVRILKLHGSCNFWPEIPGNFKGITFKGNGVDIVAPVRAMTYDETVHECRTSQFAPVMAHYAPGKSVKVSPHIIQDFQGQWYSTLKRSSAVFIIGVKINPNDDHIWGKLAESKVPLTYFGVTSDDESDFHNWRNNNERKNSYFVKANFSEGIDFLRKTRFSLKS